MPDLTTSTTTTHRNPAARLLARRPRCLAIALLLAAVWLCSAVAGAASVIRPHREFSSVSTTDGLPHNAVASIFQDDYGYVWFGTRRGLARFDGNNLIAFGETEQLDVWSIAPLPGDTLLLGCIAGLYKFDPRSRALLRVGDDDFWVKSLCPISSAATLVGTYQGLYLYENQQLRRIPVENQLVQSNNITQIIHGDGDDFWFTTGDGLGHLGKDLMATIYRMNVGFYKSNYFTCLEKVDDTIYIGSFNKGIFCFDIATKEFSQLPVGHSDIIQSIVKDDSGRRLYIGTNGKGLHTLDLTSGVVEQYLHRRHEPSSLVSNAIITLLHRDGITWVGTQFGGVSYTTPEMGLFHTFRTREFASSDFNTRSLYIYPNGDMLMGTRWGIAYLTSLGDIPPCVIDGLELRSGIILYAGEANGRILLCTFGGGVYEFDRMSRSIRDFAREEYAIYGRVFHFVAAPGGEIYFATEEGLIKTDSNGHELRRYDSLNSQLHYEAAYYLSLDNEDRLWIATKFGLFILDVASGKMVEGIDGLPDQLDVRYFFKDGDDNMWICSNRGAYCIDTNLKVVRALTPDNGLPESDATTAIDDAMGNIWISTLHNIVRYNPANGSLDVFHSNDGLGQGDFSGSVGRHGDIIYWTNENGLIWIDSSTLPPLPTPNPAIRITGLLAGDRLLAAPYADMARVELPNGEKLAIKLSHMDFRATDKESYLCKLDGVDSDWRLLTGEHTVVYPSLRPGDYTFRVKNTDGSHQATLAVVVKRAPGVIALWIVAAVVCAVLLYAAVRWLVVIRRKLAMRSEVIDALRRKKSREAPKKAPDAAADSLAVRLVHAMEADRLYLNPGLNVRDVANALGCAPQELSRLLNDRLGTNFTSFINTYRVAAVKSELKGDALQRYSISAIGLRCGFSSKVTFFRSFKALEGKTPLEFCRDCGIVAKNDE